MIPLDLMPPLMFGGLVVFMLIGFPVAFSLAALGFAFGFAGIEMGYLDFNYTSVNPNTGITPDMKAPFNSKWQASGSIEYAVDLGNTGTLTPRLDWSYQSSFYYNAVNTPLDLVAGRSLFNARLTYQDAKKDWSLSLAVTNLANKFYYAGTSYNATYGVATGTVGRPREWSITVRRNF